MLSGDDFGGGCIAWGSRSGWFGQSPQQFDASSVELLLHCRRFGVPIGITRGIQQGCPASGSLWAIGYDPVVLCLLTLRPRPWRIFVFADGIGLVGAFVAAFLAVMFPYFMLVRKVAPPLGKDGHAVLWRFRH